MDDCVGRRRTGAEVRLPVAYLCCNQIPPVGGKPSCMTFDAVQTLFHDQGQIAIKMMGFERGVTVLSGLPVPLCTPAHGTAYDIAGQGIANVEAARQAFHVACDMGARNAAKRQAAGWSE